MDVGVLLRGHPDGRSGGFLYDRYLIRALRERGHVVSIVTLPWEWGLPRQLLANLRGPPYRRLAGAEFDVLLQDALAHPALPLLNRRLDRRTSYPIVALLHMLVSHPDWRTGRLAGWLERRYLQTVDAYVMTSRETASTVSRWTPPNPGLVAYPGKDRLDRVPAGPLESASTDTGLDIAYVGNVIPRKGLDTLVQGLAPLDCEWSLTVVGDDGADPAFATGVRDRISDLGIGDRVVWTGAVPDRTLVEAYSRAAVLAVPSRYEPFGIVYAEAMGFGTIPLASTVGGGPEVLDGGRSGILVPPERPGLITDRVAALADSHRHRREFRRRARTRYGELPTWAATTASICDFLEELAA